MTEATATKPRVRKALVDDPPKTSVIPPKSPPTVEALAKELGDDVVLVTIPKGFTLTDDLYRTFPYSPGHQKMPRSHAMHWYSIKQGVSIHKG